MPDDNTLTNPATDWDAVKKSLGTEGANPQIDWDAVKRSFEFDRLQDEDKKEEAKRNTVHTFSTAAGSISVNVPKNTTDPNQAYTFEKGEQLLRGVTKGAAGTLGSMLAGTIEINELSKGPMGNPIAALKLGQDIEDWIQNDFLPTPDKFKGDFLMDQLPQGFGSMLGFMAGNLVLGPAAAALGGAAVEIDQMGRDAWNTSHDLDETVKTMMWAIPIGASEVLGTEGIMKVVNGWDKIPKPLRKTIIKKLIKWTEGKGWRKLITAGVEEGGQELGQTIGENWTAKEIYDSQRAIFDSSNNPWSGGAIGAITGIAMAMLGLGFKHILALHPHDPYAIKGLEEQQDMLKKLAASNESLIDHEAVSSSHSTVMAMGAEPDYKIPLNDPVAEEKGLEAKRKGEGEALKETYGELEKMDNANILDAVYILGKKNTKNYIDGANNNNEGKTYSEAALDIGLSNEEMHKAHDRMYHRALATAVNSEMGKEFAPELMNGTKAEKQLRNDLMVTSVMGFGQDAWNLLKQRYVNSNIKNIDNYIREAQDAQANEKYTAARTKVRESIGKEYSQVTDLIDKKIKANIAKVISEDEEPYIEKDGNGEEKLGSEGLDPNQDDYMAWMYESPTRSENEVLAESLGKELGYQYEGVQRFKDKELHLFTHPDTRSTLGFFPEDLNKKVIKTRMEESAKQFKQLNEADAFHGSPHDFGKFKSSAIGTGEGVQSYGYGLYFSSKEEIAKFYAEEISKHKSEVYSELDSDTRKKVEQLDRDMADLQAYIESEAGMNDTQASQAWMDLQDQKNKLMPPTRNVYQVKLWEGKNQNLLDWDKAPTEEQSKAVINQLEKEGFTEEEYPDEFERIKDTAEGQALYTAVAQIYLTNSEGFYKDAIASFAQASFLLERAGIDGIQYIGDSSGVMNYVVFDPEQIKIQEHHKYESEFPRRKDFRQQDTEKTGQRQVTYGDQLKDFNGSTVGDLVTYLKDTGIMPPEYRTLASLMDEAVGDLPLTVETVVNQKGKEVRGAYLYNPSDLSQRGTLKINPNTNVSDSANLARTLLHESLHAWTKRFLVGGSYQAEQLKAKLNGLMEDVRYAIANPTDRQGRARWLLENDTLRRRLFSGDLKGEFDHYTQDLDEFIVGVMSGHPLLTEILRKTVMKEEASMPKENALMRFFRQLFSTLSEVFGKKIPADSALNEFASIMSEAYDPLTEFHNAELGKPLPSERFLRLQKMRNKDSATDEGEYNDQERLAENLDPGQEDENNPEAVIDISTVRGFTEFIADLTGEDPNDYLYKLKGMTPESLTVFLQELNTEHKGIVEERFKSLYSDEYRKRFWRSTADTKEARRKENYEDFKRSLITRKLNRAQEISLKTHYSVSFIQQPDGEKVVRFNRLPSTFKTADGKTASAYREDTTLDKFLPKLQELMGLEDGDIEIAYINGFDQYRANRNNIPRWLDSKNLSGLQGKDLALNRYSKGGESLSQDIADIIGKFGIDKVNNKRIIYLGNFSGKNTFPVLVISTAQDSDGKSPYTKYIEFLKKVWPSYRAAIENNKTFKYVPTGKGYRTNPGVIRAILEDLWYGADFSPISEGKNFNTIAGQLDWNKVQKRGTKWVHPHTATQESAEWLETATKALNMGDEPSPGIRYDKGSGQVMVRMAIFNSISKDEKGKEVEATIKVGDQTFNVKDLLINKTKKTATTDGASFYIIGGLDKYYHIIHGTLKDGALKNVLSSQPGQRPLFIKHAMHGLHADDPLALWMAKNNIGLLISDESAKIGKAAIQHDNDGNLTPSSGYGSYNLEEIQNGDARDDERTFELPLNQFMRIKEEQNINLKGGKPRQMYNGTSLIPQNPVFSKIDPQGHLLKHISTLVNFLGGNFKGAYTELTPQTMMERLQKLIYYPQSPKQQALSDVLKDALSETDLEKLVKTYGGILDHPGVSEHLNKKLKEPLQEALQMVTTGWRSALGPSIGWLAQSSQVDPIFTFQNLKWMITALPANHEVMQAAIPEADIRQAVMDKRALQRDLALAGSKRDKAQIKELKEAIKEVEDKLNTLADGYIDKANKEKQPNIDLVNRMNAGKRSFTNFVNFKDAKVRSYVNELKSKIIDPQSGRINKDYAIITQDDASRYGVKTGDRILIIVTPTDSALSVSSVTVAAVLPVRGVNKLSDNNKIIMNSEYIQTLVGKDFDIDTASIIPFDSQYADVESWNNFLDVIKDSNKKYVSDIVNTMNSLFKKHKLSLRVDENTAFEDGPRIRYAQLLLGSLKGKKRPAYTMIGQDFHTINDAYLKNKAIIINERLFHTGLSAINFKAMNVDVPIYAKGNHIKNIKMNFNINNNNWFQTHLLEMIITNHLLDFPNNTSILEYNGDMAEAEVSKKIAGLTWGLSEADLRDLPEHYISALGELRRVLFNQAFYLARDRDLVTRGKASYTDLATGILNQQYILDMLAKGDKAGLTQLYDNYVDSRTQAWMDKWYNYQYPSDWAIRTKAKIDQQAIEKKAFISNFIDALTTDHEDGSTAVYDYGLFNLISKIDPLEAPIYGMTQKEALATEAYTDRDLLLMYPLFKAIMRDDIIAEIQGNRKTYFEDSKTKRPYTGYEIEYKDGHIEAINPDIMTIALSILPRHYDYRNHKELMKEFTSGTKRNPVKRLGYGPTERAQRVAIAIFNGMSEVRSEGNPSADEQMNRWARAEAFPRMMKALLNEPIVRFSGGASNIKLDTGIGTIELRSDNGQLKVMANDQAYSAGDILKADSPETKRLYELLITENGLWGNYKNRLALSNLLYFVDNLSIENRQDLVADWIEQELYGNNDVGRQGQLAFWLSFMGLLTNNAIKDNRAMGLQLSRGTLDKEKPYDIPQSLAALQMLSHYEPALRDAFLFAYHKNSNLIYHHNVAEVAEALRENKLGAEDSAILFEKDFDPLDAEEQFSDIVYDHIKEMDPGKTTLRDSRRLYDMSYGEALDVVKKQLKDEAMIAALSESGYKIDEVVHDIRTLKPNQFKAKYDNMASAVIHEAFSRYEEDALSDLEAKTEYNKTNAKLVQLHYVFSKVRSAYLKNNGKATFWSGLRQVTKFIDFYVRGKEKKIYAHADVNDPIGSQMVVDSERPEPITTKDLDAYVSTFATSHPRTHGEATLAIVKTTKLGRAISGKAAHMTSHLTYINLISQAMHKPRARSTLARTVESRDPRLAQILKDFDHEAGKEKKGKSYLRHVRRMVFHEAENLKDRTGITIVEGARVKTGVGENTKGTYIYLYKGKIFDEALGHTVYDLLDAYKPNATAEEKLTFLQAIEYRKMYDISARRMVQSAINYLKTSLETIIADGKEIGEEAEWIRSALTKYNQYLDALNKRRGNYMPHQYPVAMFRVLWQRQYKKMLENQLKAERKKHQNFRAQNRDYDARIANKTDQQIREETAKLLEEGWRRIEAKIGDTTTFIPNFQQRNLIDSEIRYNDVSNAVHNRYISELAAGIDNDLSLTDFYLYYSRARAIGENPVVIQAMKSWYGNKMSNKILHSNPMKWEKIAKRKGAEVSFLTRMDIADEEAGVIPSEVRVSGIVEKVDPKNDQIKLFVDLPKRKFEISQKLAKARRTHDDIISRGITAGLTTRQLETIRDLKRQGYLGEYSSDEIAAMSVPEASETIIDGLVQAYNDPARSGIFKLSEIYTRDLNGKKLSDSADLYHHRGAIEHFEAHSRELENVKAINGKFSNTMQKVEYGFYKTVGTGLRFLNTAYRKVLGYGLLAGWHAPKAFMRNATALLFGNWAHSPWRGMSLAFQGMKYYWRVSHGILDRMDNEEQAIYNTLISLSIANTSDLMNLTLGRLNVKESAQVGEGSRVEKMRYLFKVWQDGSGYKDYIKRLTDIEEKLTKTKNESEAADLIFERNRLKLKWRAHVEGLLEEGEQYTDDQVSEAIAKARTLKAEDENINLAEREGITRGMAAKLMFNEMGSFIFEGAWWLPIGLKIQAAAEWGRIPAFFTGFMMARDQGYSVEESIPYGINYVESFNAFYGPENKQLGTGTAGGKSLLMFAQYMTNAVKRMERLAGDALVQYLGRTDIDKERKIAGIRALGKVAEMYKRDFITEEERQKKAIDKDYNQKKEINLLRLLTWRAGVMLAITQAGNVGLIRGLQYIADPFFVMVYDLWDAVMSGLSGTLPDDSDELKQWLLAIMFDTVYALGVPVKQLGMALMAPEDKGMMENIVAGRLSQQFDDTQRMINTIRAASGEEMSRKERKLTITGGDGVWGVNNFLGFGILGTTVHSKEEGAGIQPDFFQGLGEVNYPGYDRPMTEDERYLNMDTRFGMFADPIKVFFPSGDRMEELFKKIMK